MEGWPGVAPRVLASQSAPIDTTIAAGRFVFAIFGPVAEFERQLIPGRTLPGVTDVQGHGSVLDGDDAGVAVG